MPLHNQSGDVWMTTRGVLYILVLIIAGISTIVFSIVTEFVLSTGYSVVGDTSVRVVPTEIGIGWGLRAAFVTFFVLCVVVTRLIPCREDVCTVELQQQEGKP